MPPIESAEDDLVAVGADLEPGTILEAYRHGLFPMPVERDHVGWWSPQARGVLPLEQLRVSRSLRRSARKFEVRVDSAFDEVIRACADPTRPFGWINDQILESYSELHSLGWVHSVESYNVNGELVGGLYGVVIGGLFAGESMFHRETDASKVALLHLTEILRADQDARRLLDVQWKTKHLASLGVTEIGRADYQDRLRYALLAPIPSAFLPPSASTS